MLSEFSWNLCGPRPGGGYGQFSEGLPEILRFPLMFCSVSGKVRGTNLAREVVTFLVRIPCRNPCGIESLSRHYRRAGRDFLEPSGETRSPQVPECFRQSAGSESYPGN